MGFPLRLCLLCCSACYSVLQYDEVCCNVLQCVARSTFGAQVVNLPSVTSSFCVAVCCSVLQCVAVCCSMLQRVAVCCSALNTALLASKSRGCLLVLQCVLQRVAVYCSVLQCIAVCLLCFACSTLCEHVIGLSSVASSSFVAVYVVIC